MFASRAMFLALAGLSAAGVASAGQFNRALNIGDDAPAWVQLPGTDGQKHSLADLKDKDVVVMVFTCNSCEVAEAYEDRLIAFAKKHASTGSKVAVVAVNVNTIPADRLDKMKERAAEKGFPFPYLYDESQKLGKLYGAMYTPEFFVLNKARKIVYMGAMDDHSPPAEPQARYLEHAVQATLKGEKPPVAETLARGCRVRYAKTR
ncbi:MAG: thioredoxin family protein [Gemmataceae bacterium]